jgi:hypothetical protein
VVVRARSLAGGCGRVEVLGWRAPSSPCDLHRPMHTRVFDRESLRCPWLPLGGSRCHAMSRVVTRQLNLW